MLTSKDWGHLGGDQVTAEFKTGAAGSPLSVAVTGKDIVVNLATDAGGASTSTAAQVVAAINASPEAAALVSAMTYRSNAGAGIVIPRAEGQPGRLPERARARRARPVPAARLPHRLRP